MQENTELKFALKAKRKQPIFGKVMNYINAVQECLQRIERKVDKMQDNFHQNLDSVEKTNLEKFIELERKMEKIEHSRSTFPLYPQYVQHWLNNLSENY